MLELGTQLLSLAQRVQDPALLVRAHRMLGDTLFWLGELGSARIHMEQGLAFYNREQHRSDVFSYGYDPGVFALFYASWILWFLGYPDQALDKNQKALALAQELAHPFSLASTLAFAAQLHQYHGEVHLVQERAEACKALSTERGFALWVVWGTLLQGWVRVEEGQREEGITDLHRGLADYHALGARVGQSAFLALLAEACEKEGRFEEGLTVLADALEVVKSTGERVWEAELYRLKGKLMLHSSVEKGAEDCFQRAIEIARHQEAKSLELRAVMSLARLWQQQGKRAEAHHLLSEIYGWFTEGFETKDLHDAKALLSDLATPA